MKAETEKELSDYFKRLAERHEEDEGEIKTIFQDQYEKIIKSPSMVGKSEVKRIKRTKTAMNNYFRNMKRNGKKFTFIPFGHIDKPKDWNAKELKEIGALAKAGRSGELLSKERILYKVEHGTKIAVTGNLEWGKRKVFIKGGNVYLKEVDDSVEATQHFIIDGTPLQSGKSNVIPRDSRIYSGKSDKVNFKWSQELTHNFTANVWGIGFPSNDSDDVKMIHYSLRGEQANPYSNDYFFKKYPPFRPYESELSVIEKDGVWELGYTGQLNPANAEIPGVSDDNIDDVIEANLEDIREKYAKAGITTFVPPVIYIDGLESFHKTTVKYKADGKAEKTKSGYDMTEWGRYAILLADLEQWNASVDPTKGNYYFFSDGDSDKRQIAFGDPTQYNANPIIPGTPVISLIKTSRGPMRYDRKTKSKIPDPENGDIGINVCTIRNLPRVDIEIDDSDDYEEED